MRTHHPTQAHLGKANTPSNTGTHVGRQWQTMGDNESNGEHWETMEDKGKQELAKVDTPSNTGTHTRGDNGETRPGEGEHTFQHRHTCATIGDNGRQAETRGDKTSGRRTRHPTQAHICGETMGDKGRQNLGKADNTGTYVGDKGRQTLGRRTHHPTQAHMWGQWETMGDNGRQGETRGDKGETRGDKTWGRWTHQPTPRRTP